MGVWGIRFSYEYEAVEIIKETDKTVTCKHASWGNTRTDKVKMPPWRGTEEAAHRLAAKLTGARAEYSRRRQAASDWFKAREAEIFASGMEARSGETEGLDPKDDSPAPQGETPNLSEDHP